QVRQEAALRVIAAVNFIQKVNALDGNIVIIGGDNIGVVFELLDIHNRDFGFAGMVVDHLVRFDIAGKCVPRVDRMDGQAASGEFTLGLLQQVEPVDNKVELGNDLLLLEVVR